MVLRIFVRKLEIRRILMCVEVDEEIQVVCLLTTKVREDSDVLCHVASAD